MDVACIGSSCHDQCFFIAHKDDSISWRCALPFLFEFIAVFFQIPLVVFVHPATDTSMVIHITHRQQERVLAPVAAAATTKSSLSFLPQSVAQSQQQQQLRMLILLFLFIAVFLCLLLRLPRHHFLSL
jgi:hypothetical protein